jgi:hypothetical protein
VIGSTLSLIDTQTNQVRPPLTLGGSVTELDLEPGGSHGLVLAENGLVSLNASSGEIVGRVDGFIRPAQVVFAPAQAAVSRR